ncbi:uncharacterized protein LOC128951677 [Oppia nitens]|uniref:uncharacterized protein LOC128951677 n=1 Tax=Oppia nitens TaxID=1686743 RepID=UPI0023DC3335|nr:uncharacterized protein LOC128951677 [Oppia nitens]
MRHSRIAKSKRHKKLKIVPNCDDEDIADRHVSQKNLCDQFIPRKWTQICQMKQLLTEKNKLKKKRKKKNMKELITVRINSDVIEKGMTRNDKPLPSVIEQGLYESQSHFLSRLSRLSAKARAEANIEERFDVDFCEKLDTSDDKTNAMTDTKGKAKNIKKNERKKLKRKRHNKETSFDHLEDNVLFGERVDEPPNLNAFNFKKKLKTK